MAFPTVRSTALSQEGSAVTSHTINYATGAVAGETFLCFVSSDGDNVFDWAAAESSIGWVKLYEVSSSDNNATLSVAYRKADGGESGSFELSSAENEQSVARMFCLSAASDPDADPPEVGASSQSPGSATVTFNTVTPGGGVQDYLWFIGVGYDDDDDGFGHANGVWPTNYATNGQYDRSNTGNGTCGLDTSYRTNNASSESPGDGITDTAEEWVSVAIGVFSDIPTTFERDLSDDLTLTENLDRDVINVRILSDSLTLTDSIDSEVITPRFWDEKFEAAGRDETWSDGETTSGGATINDDFATSSVTGAPTDWDILCCEFAFSAAEDCYLDQQWGADSPVIYYRGEIIVGAESLSDGEQNEIFHMYEVGSNLIARFYVGKDVTEGLRIVARIYHDAAANEYTFPISVDTRYRIELKWDSAANTWEWRVDGATQNSGSLTSTAVDWGLERLAIGPSGAAAAMVLYVDNIALDSSDWVGPAGAATVSRDLSDDLTLTDSLDREVRNVRALVESLTLTENLVPHKATLRELSDSLTLTDTLIPYKRLIRELSDSLTLTDTLERDVQNVRTLLDSLTLTDALSRDVVNLRLLNESLALLDALDRAVRNTRDVAEALTLSDTLVPTVTQYSPPNPPTYGIRRRAGRM